MKLLTSHDPNYRIISQIYELIIHISYLLSLILSAHPLFARQLLHDDKFNHVFF